MMLKRCISMLVFFSLILLSACSRFEDEYELIWEVGQALDETTVSVLSARSDGSFRILQITDFHLTYGFDSNDRKTFNLIEQLVLNVEPDLIVITGDLTMSPYSEALSHQIGRFFARLGVPWAYVFGNHEIDFNQSRAKLQAVLAPYAGNMFQRGPSNVQGEGNYLIRVLNASQEDAYALFFLDTHADREYYVNGKYVTGYDYLYQSQIDWYKDRVETLSLEANRVVDSLVFLHIPLVEYEEIKNLHPSEYEGEFHEGPYVPLENTGFFDQVVRSGSTKGIFAGHDHINDFSFSHQGILLAYGRLTGYNAYAMKGFERGGRIIDLFNLNDVANATFETRIILASEVYQND